MAFAPPGADPVGALLYRSLDESSRGLAARAALSQALDAKRGNAGSRKGVSGTHASSVVAGVLLASLAGAVDFPQASEKCLRGLAPNGLREGGPLCLAAGICRGTRLRSVRPELLSH